MRWMSDDLDSRIFFTLKNHVVLQCVLKYLDVVNKIQFLTFLKLNRGWSYKDNIITVGENWDVVFLLLCFFPPQNKHWNKNKPFPKMWIFTQIVAFPLNLFQANCPAIYFWQKLKTVRCEKWGRVRAGSPTRARPLVLLVTFNIGPSQDSSYYSALQDVFFNYDFLSYHS